jgi:hypothetical protein
MGCSQYSSHVVLLCFDFRAIYTTSNAEGATPLEAAAKQRSKDRDQEH